MVLYFDVLENISGYCQSLEGYLWAHFWIEVESLWLVVAWTKQIAQDFGLSR